MVVSSVEMVVLLIMLIAFVFDGSGYSPLFSFSFFSFVEETRNFSTFGFPHFTSMPASAAVERTINLLRYL